MDLGLADRSYIVTGGTRGLGRAAATALLAQGASVLVTGRTLPPAENLASLGGGQRLHALGADNGDPATCGNGLGDRAGRPIGARDFLTSFQRHAAASGSALAADHAVQVGCVAFQPFPQRVHVHPHRQRAAVGVAELRGDVGRGHAGRGQERRRGVPQGVHVDAARQANLIDEPAELCGGVSRWWRGPAP
jgi:hypothetical protein